MIFTKEVRDYEIKRDVTKEVHFYYKTCGRWSFSVLSDGKYRIYSCPSYCQDFDNLDDAVFFWNRDVIGLW